MAHGDHKCEHGHHHHHHTAGNIRFAFFLNLGFAIFELVGGLWTNSMAILSDAVHDFGDSMALGFAWALERKSHQKSDAKFSYGYRRFSVLSALVTGLVLVGGAVLILVETVPRFINPQMPKVPEMVLLALVGVAVNGWAAFRVSRGKSLNEKMITWHLIEDVIGWVLVLVGALIMLVWPLPLIDAVLAFVLSMWVLWNVFKNLRAALAVFLQAVPEGLAVDAIVTTVKQAFPSVSTLHHLHLWSIDGEKHVLTAHVVIEESVGREALPGLKMGIKNVLRQNFGINETTLEFEWTNEQCEDPEHEPNS